MVTRTELRMPVTSILSPIYLKKAITLMFNVVRIIIQHIMTFKSQFGLCQVIQTHGRWRLVSRWSYATVCDKWKIQQNV